MYIATVLVIITKKLSVINKNDQTELIKPYNYIIKLLSLIWLDMHVYKHNYINQ